MINDVSDKHLVALNNFHDLPDNDKILKRTRSNQDLRRISCHSQLPGFQYSLHYLKKCKKKKKRPVYLFKQSL